MIVSQETEPPKARSYLGHDSRSLIDIFLLPFLRTTPWGQVRIPVSCQVPLCTYRDPFHSWTLYVVGQWADHWMRSSLGSVVKTEGWVCQA